MRELYEEIVRAVREAVYPFLARVDGGGGGGVVAVQLLEREVYVLRGERAHAAYRPGGLCHGQGRGDEEFLVQHGELRGLRLLLRVRGDYLDGELHEQVHERQQHNGRGNVEEALEVCYGAAVHRVRHELRYDACALQYAHDYHEENGAYDVEEDVSHTRALGVSRGSERAEEGRDDAGAYVDAHDERVDELEGHRPRHGERLQHADDGRAALDDDGDRNADDYLEHGHFGKAGQQVNEGLGFSQGGDGISHGHHAGEQYAEADADLAGTFDAALFDKHDEDDADYERRGGEGRGLEDLEDYVAAGLYVHEADDLGGDRGADVGAHDDADGLPERQDTRGEKADGEDDGSRGGLDYGRDQHTGQKARERVSRELLQQDAERVAGAFLEALAHDLHAEEEHGQAAEHGYDTEYIHTYTPLQFYVARK